jgi:hypothetical protein
MLVVEVLVAGSEEAGEAECPDLFGGVLAGEQAVEVAALAFGLGHAAVEAEQHLAGLGGACQQGHGGDQDQRDQPGLQREQRGGDAQDADGGAEQAEQPVDQLHRSGLAAERGAQQPVVEGGGLVGLQLDRAGHVDDAALGVALGAGAEQGAGLPAERGGEPEGGDDRGEGDQAGQHARGRRAGAGLVGGQDSGQHAAAEQQHDRQSEAAHGLEGDGEEQFSGACGPDQRDRVAGQAGQPAQQLGVVAWPFDDVEQVLAAGLARWASGRAGAVGGLVVAGSVAHGHRP